MPRTKPKNTRSWTTVAIGRPQYGKLRRAAKKRGTSAKAVVNKLAEGWADQVLGNPLITITDISPRK